VEVFERLGMHRTAAHHGVLIYVAIEDRKLAVLGDRGIHERVGQPYWDRLSRPCSPTSGRSGPATDSGTRFARWARSSGSTSPAGRTTSTSCPIG